MFRSASTSTATVLYDTYHIPTQSLGNAEPSSVDTKGNNGEGEGKTPCDMTTRRIQKAAERKLLHMLSSKGSKTDDFIEPKQQIIQIIVS